MHRLTTLTLDNPLGQAFWALRIIFTVAPILAGLDKFFHVMVDWTQYLAPWVPSLLNVSPTTFMQGVGIVEIGAGLLVAFLPRFGAYLVMFWLWGIIVNLLTGRGFLDIAFRDLGLSVGALALGRLAQAHHMEQHGQVPVGVTRSDWTEERRAA
jgi:hypothetical protein